MGRCLGECQTVARVTPTTWRIFTLKAASVFGSAMWFALLPGLRTALEPLLEHAKDSTRLGEVWQRM